MRMGCLTRMGCLLLIAVIAVVAWLTKRSLVVRITGHATEPPRQVPCGSRSRPRARIARGSY